MKGQKDCPWCKGSGLCETVEDLHNSGGLVPCYFEPEKKTKKRKT